MSEIEKERRLEEAEDHIRTAVMNEICDVMAKTNLPPMMLLRLAARSIGAIYREMADAHSGVEPCPCGWRPNPEADVESLGLALVSACDRFKATDLRRMPIAGTA